MRKRKLPSSRDRLIRAAANLFYLHGIHHTSVDAVVAEAGLTKPTLYKNFPSKDDLVAAVVDYRSQNWDLAIEARVAVADTPEAKLLAVFDFLDEFIEDDPFRGCALVNASVEIFNANDPSRAIACKNKQANRRRIEALAREAGLLNPKALASSLSLLFEGAILTAYVESDPQAGGWARKAAEQLIESHRPAPGSRA